MQRNEWRDQLISEHTDIARRIALKMARRCPDWVAREDLVAAGLLGLTEAAARYDESRPEAFLPFAEHRIRGAVIDELRRGDHLPRRVRQIARKIALAIRALENSGETATDQRLAEALGVTVESYRTRLAHLVHVEIEPLDDESSVLFADPDQGPDALASHQETLSRLRDALHHLPPRDVTILGLHFIEDLSYQEIATTLSITPSRVCQVMWRAVDRLRAHLGEVGEHAARGAA